MGESIVSDQTRDERIDLAKGLAVVAMIQVHVLELFMEDGFRLSSIGDLGRFLGGPLVAPVFMLIFGYLLFRRERGWRYLIKRGLGLFASGLLLNVALNGHLLGGILLAEWQIEPWPFVLGVDILLFAGLSAILLALLHLAVGGMPRFRSLLVALVVVLLVSPWLTDQLVGVGEPMVYAIAFVAGDAFWSYFPVFPWFSYVLMGGLLALLHAPAGHRRLALMLSLGVALVLASSQYDVATDLKRYYHHDALFFIWTLALCRLAWELVSRWIASGACNALRGMLVWLGRHLTAIYVAQWLLIGNLATALYRSQPGWSFIAWVSALLGCSCLLVMAYQRLRNR